MILDNDNCWCHKDMSPETFRKCLAQGHDAECIHDEISDDQGEDRAIVVENSCLVIS